MGIAEILCVEFQLSKPLGGAWLGRSSSNSTTRTRQKQQSPASSYISSRRCSIHLIQPRRSPLLSSTSGASFSAWKATGKKACMTRAAAFDADLSEQVSGHGKELKPLEAALGLGLLLACEKGLGLVLSQWKALPAPARGLPSATLGMLLVFSVLLTLDRFAPNACRSVNSFFAASVEAVQRWMPLFYAPALVVLPLSLKKLQIAEGIKLLLLVVGSWASTILVTALWASLIRKRINTRLEEAPNMSSPPPFGLFEMLTWVGVGAAGGALTYLSPTILGNPARTMMPFFLAATITGLLLGSHFPGPVKRFLHPVVTSAIFVNIAALFYSITTQQNYASVLGLYLTNSLKEPGAGDVLMALLGPLALSYGFVLYQQRRILRRHAVEMASVIPLAGLFSLFITGFAGHYSGLSAQLTRSAAPSSITFAFSLPMSNLLQANPSLVATSCILTGILGANLSALLLSALKVEDLMTKGFAAACSSHGYGSASIAAGESDLLPFCALSYILMGAFCSLLCSIPIARNAIFL